MLLLILSVLITYGAVFQHRSLSTLTLQNVEVAEPLYKQFAFNSAWVLLYL